MENTEWNVGDKFKTPETGEKIFTVTRVNTYDVEAIDYRSRTGFTIFSKNYIEKVQKIKKTQSEIEIDKYDNLQKIVEQLEKCEYECIGGMLKNNVAFIALKRMADKHCAVGGN